MILKFDKNILFIQYFIVYSNVDLKKTFTIKCAITQCVEGTLLDLLKKNYIIPNIVVDGHKSVQYRAWSTQVIAIRLDHTQN